MRRDRENWVALCGVTGDSPRLEKVFSELRCSYNGTLFHVEIIVRVF